MWVTQLDIITLGNNNHIYIFGGPAVDPRVLSEVLVKLYRLRLYRTLLTSEQLRFYFLKLAETEDSKLEYLEIGKVDLSSIPGEILGPALVRVECVDLMNTNITPEQVYDVYWSVLIAKKINLRQLCLDINVKSIVTSNVLSEAKSKMKVVILDDFAISLYFGLEE